MPRFPFLAGILCSCVAFGQTPGASPDTRLDDALKELTAMRRTAADQERRIAALERTVRTMQITLQPMEASARRVQLATARTPEGWAGIRLGMSREQTGKILGDPQSVDSVIDRQTLYYKNGSETLGTIVLIDDRVSEVVSRRFQIYIPERTN